MTPLFAPPAPAVTREGDGLHGFRHTSTPAKSGSAVGVRVGDNRAEMSDKSKEPSTLFAKNVGELKAILETLPEADQVVGVTGPNQVVILVLHREGKSDTTIVLQRFF